MRRLTRRATTSTSHRDRDSNVVDILGPLEGATRRGRYVSLFRVPRKRGGHGVTEMACEE
jgi:hypothetical protein